MDAFLGREEDLQSIEELLGRIRGGEKTNLCLLGVPGSGKSTLLKEYVSRNRERWEEEGVIPVYLSLRSVGDSPQELAAGFAGEVLARVAFTFRNPIDITELRRPETFQSSAASIRSPALAAFLTTLAESPLGGDGHPMGLIRSAFGFPNAFAEEKRIRLLLFVDDFGELKRFSSPGMSAFEEFHQALEDQTEAFYITAMEHSPFSDTIFFGDEAPLKEKFQVAVLQGMSVERSRELALAMLDAPAEGPATKAAELLARLSGGNPLVLRHLARGTAQSAGSEPPTADHVTGAFATEVLSPLGKVYRHYLTNLQRSVGEKTDFLKARKLLASLAEGKAVKPEDMKVKAGVDLQTAARLTSRILGSGLFRKVEDAFYFDDPLFRFWALKTDPADDQGNARFDSSQARDLAREFLQLKHGKKKKKKRKKAGAPAKKFNFRELISACKGRTVPGEHLGAEADVSFPNFEKIKGFAFSTRQVKMYYLEGDGEYWALMIVWWSVAADRSEIEILANKAGKRLDRVWFVCRGGFTEDARQSARQAGILLSDESDLKLLLEALP